MDGGPQRPILTDHLRSTFLVAVIVYVLSYLNYQVNRFNLKLPLRSVKH
ncbi:hypothetical protein SAMN05720354_11647 [Nitrosospira sp. Nsp1]|nr:hypothetical protein SAMN05720354_11647 [Nitrosospira sp. Nsp1]